MSGRAGVVGGGGGVLCAASPLAPASAAADATADGVGAVGLSHVVRCEL